MKRRKTKPPVMVIRPNRNERTVARLALVLAFEHLDGDTQSRWFRAARALLERLNQVRP